MLTVPLPNGVVPHRRVVRRVKKKEQEIQEAAKEQIKDRKEAVKKGEVVPGHVPPVKGVKKAKKKRKKVAQSPAQKLTAEVDKMPRVQEPKPTTPPKKKARKKTTK
jgi:hypothetical protein